MVDNTVAGEPPVPPEEDADELSNLPTLFLAFITLAIYLLFLKPTAGDGDDTTAANETAARGQQRQRRAARRPVPQQQQQQQQQQAPRRRLQMSENAIEVLETCRSHPPHVVPSSIPVSKRSIGGFEVLLENGLVAFSHTVAASPTSGNAISKPSKSGDAPAAVTMDRAASTQSSSSDASLLLQRKERAKILSRLFAARETAPGKALPSPPAKGSTFVIGISQAKHLADSSQRSSLVRVVKGLAAHYTVLVVVLPAATITESGYESTRKLHSEAERLLRGRSSSTEHNGDDNDPSTLSESVLPSHRILLAGSATGRVALVRQLSTNIGLTVDFDTTVKEELERFRYEVSIVNDWKSILPATPAPVPAGVAKPS